MQWYSNAWQFFFFFVILTTVSYYRNISSLQDDELSKYNESDCTGDRLLILFTFILAAASVPFPTKGSSLISGMIFFVSLCTLHFGYCFIMCPNSCSNTVTLCFPFVFVPCRDLSAHQGQTNSECACRHLLSSLLPVCWPFQWGAGGIPHDATCFWNSCHWPIGPHR